MVNASAHEADKKYLQVFSNFRLFTMMLKAPVAAVYFYFLLLFIYVYMFAEVQQCVLPFVIIIIIKLLY